MPFVLSPLETSVVYPEKHGAEHKSTDSEMQAEKLNSLDQRYFADRFVSVGLESKSARLKSEAAATQAYGHKRAFPPLLLALRQAAALPFVAQRKKSRR
jgi:hypothetical protein